MYIFLFWAGTGCAVSMSNTRGVAVCDAHVTRTGTPIENSNISTVQLPRRRR